MAGSVLKPVKSSISTDSAAPIEVTFIAALLKKGLKAWIANLIFHNFSSTGTT